MSKSAESSHSVDLLYDRSTLPHQDSGAGAGAVRRDGESVLGDAAGSDTGPHSCQVSGRRLRAPGMAPLGDGLGLLGQIRQDFEERGLLPHPTFDAEPVANVSQCMGGIWIGDLLATNLVPQRWQKFNPGEPNSRVDAALRAAMKEAIRLSPERPLEELTRAMVELLLAPWPEHPTLRDPWNREVYGNVRRFLRSWILEQAERSRRHLIDKMVCFALQIMEHEQLKPREKQAERRAQIREAHAREPELSQRELAEQAGVSLGLVNKALRERSRFD
jgi:hypothetical protein